MPVASPQTQMMSAVFFCIYRFLDLMALGQMAQFLLT